MRVLGHRGASAVAPENTVEAFVRAFEDGADGVELDVRPCRSGELVVIHDPGLDRLFGDPRAVCDLDLAELRRVAPRLATLDEAWDAIGSRGTVSVEVKSDRIPWQAVPARRVGAPWHTSAEAVRRWLRRRDLLRAPADLVLSSFDPRILAWLAVRARSVPRGLLFETTQRVPVAPALLARLLGCVAIHPEHPLATEALVRSARASRLVVSAWTVDEENELLRLRELGVDSVMTNDPARARLLLGRGQNES